MSQAKNMLDEFASMGKQLSAKFNLKDLHDTPSGYDEGKILQSTATGLEWVDMPAGGGGSAGGDCDGGAGSKTLVKESNNFYTNLPDAILAFDDIDDERVLYLTHYGEHHDAITYQNNTASRNYTLRFNHLTPSGELTSNSQNTRALYDSLSGYVANDRAIYFGGNCTLEQPIDLSDTNLQFQAETTPVNFIHKELGGNVTSDQQITDFNFANLVTGKTYKLNSTLSFHSTSDTSLVQADFYNGTKKLVSVYNEGRSSSQSTSMMFIAEQDSLSVHGVDLSSSDYIRGGNNGISFVQLELPNSVIVTIDQETISPDPDPASGVFAISEINTRSSFIDNSGTAIQFSDLGSFQDAPFEISEINTRTAIQNTGSEDFGSNFPEFSVTQISEIHINTFIGNTGSSSASNLINPTDRLTGI